MKRSVLAALTAVLLLLTACANGAGENGPYQLYFTADRATRYGSALQTQEWEGETNVPTARALMDALLAGPTAEGLTTPFPKGVSVQSLEPDASGTILRLTLSEQYSGLTDISKTLADACIVMTLCQLPGIEAVEIRTAGFWASRPASRTLYASELELDALLP